ncbi:PP2C family protein-serine/threonine phosphatase [Paenibacillus hexagrammi]|uniref:Protein phosphatase 2C domain-containing protein n=1 Tax=Paenibacillus hexagrammi TaxID=2908839 RepID=A0ABY3SFI4_9BACL|nr:protein phosphatase 2C domain-containing protein [Paenibacillus sp. YPD9-1]UJF32218.1 protein phosphatase 2C domain-containing protein [Paenibacillus sp. YPD9-1]
MRQIANWLITPEAVPYTVLTGWGILFILLLLLRGQLKARLSFPAIRVGNGQTIGLREEQDDYFATAFMEHGALAVLGDGISGMANGRLASTAAVTVFVKEFQRLGRSADLRSFFAGTARRSNEEIVSSLGGGRGGTTLVAAVVSDGLLYWGSVGDSILTVYRNGEFIPINSRQTFGSVLQSRYLSGEITKEEAVTNPLQHRLVNYLGHEGFKDIEVGNEPFRLQKKDKVILCSDGVYHALTEMEIEQLLRSSRHPQQAAERIIEAVEAKGRSNQDNATIVILDKGW